MTPHFPWTTVISIIATIEELALQTGQLKERKGIEKKETIRKYERKQTRSNHKKHNAFNKFVCLGKITWQECWKSGMTRAVLRGVRRGRRRRSAGAGGALGQTIGARGANCALLPQSGAQNDLLLLQMELRRSRHVQWRRRALGRRRNGGVHTNHRILVFERCRKKPNRNRYGISFEYIFAYKE